MPDVATLDALVTVINALSAGTALIIHAWGHTHPRMPKISKDQPPKEDTQQTA